MKQVHQFHGHWISGPIEEYGEEDALYYQDHPNTLLKKEVLIEDVQDATLFIACLGYYLVYLNGVRVSDVELNHDWTNPKACVYYEQYDVRTYLKQGRNELTIMLGNGMYNPSPLRLFGKYNLREQLHEVGQPQILCDLMINKQCVASSDETWCSEEGNLLFNNLYLGETIDFTREASVSKPVQVLEKQRVLKQSFLPKCKILGSVEHSSIEPYEQGLLVDFHEMISGFIDIQVDLLEGQQVTLQYSERLVDGHLDFISSYAGSVGSMIQDHRIDGGKGAPLCAIQTDRIIGKQGHNHYRNLFTWHSFRYVYIQGCRKQQIEQIRAHYVHANLQEIGHVQVGHPFLNELYEAALRTKLNNVHATFEDCARERLGYGGDMVALAMSNLYIFDLEALYKKIILDFRFEQTALGGISETAPYMGIQSNGTGPKEGPLLWQLVYPYLLCKHYQFYGDQTLLKQEYPYVKKQLTYLLSRDIEELAQCCLGDHGSILIAGEFRKPTPDKLFVGYCSILLLLKYAIQIQKILQEDTTQFEANYDRISSFVIQKFQHKDGSFGDATQTSYAFAILLALGDPKQLCAQFVKQIKANNYILDSGIFGMAFTYEVLTRYGYDEVIEAWLLQESKISFHEMLKSGNKALSELFIGEHQSYNHAMFSSYQQWYYEGLAGIRVQEDACAFSHLHVRPYFSKNIDQVSASIVTKQGLIKSEWFKDEETIIWKLTIPKGIQAELEEPHGYALLHKECHDQTMTYLYQPA